MISPYFALPSSPMAELPHSPVIDSPSRPTKETVNHSDREISPEGGLEQSAEPVNSETEKIEHNWETLHHSVHCTVAQEDGEPAQKIGQPQKQSISNTQSVDSWDTEYYILHITGGEQVDVHHYPYGDVLILATTQAHICPHHEPKLSLEALRTTHNEGNPNLIERMVLEDPTEQIGILFDVNGKLFGCRDNCACILLLDPGLDIGESED